MRICSRCNQEKEVSAFYLTSKGKPASVCAECSKLKMRNRTLEEKRAARLKEKINGSRNKGSPESNRKCVARYRLKNPGKVANQRKAYKLRSIKQTPKWADSEATNAIYELAAQLRKEQPEFDWHVDHVVPLRGKNVSGLHIHTNLQIIPGKVNMKKKNKWVV